MASVSLWCLRPAVFFFVLWPILAGAGAYSLYFRGPPLPAAPQHARVAPTINPLKGLAACWVETGSTFTGFPFAMTGSSILVKHPAGDLLIDTGNSMHFDDEIAGYPFLLRLNLKNLPGQLNPECPPPS